jgi:hypothetical protein
MAVAVVMVEAVVMTGAMMTGATLRRPFWQLV